MYWDDIDWQPLGLELERKLPDTYYNTSDYAKALREVVEESRDLLTRPEHRHLLHGHTVACQGKVDAAERATRWAETERDALARNNAAVLAEELALMVKGITSKYRREGAEAVLRWLQRKAADPE